jgi:hypothetical protein
MKLRIALYGELSLEEAVDLSQDRLLLHLDLELIFRKLLLQILA